MSKEEKDIGKIIEEMLNRPLELIEENKKLKKKIDKLQEENKNADERNYSLGLGFIQIGEKLGLENFGIQTILLGIDTLQKENEELEKDKKELFEEYQKRLKEKFDLEQKISNIIENSYNDIDYFNRDMRKDFEDLLKE